MVGTRFIIGAVIAWLIVLAIVHILLRGKGKNRNPLDWPEVDRCIFLVSTFFFLGVRNIFGKIIERYGEEGNTHLIRFTSVPPEAAAYFHAHRQHGAAQETEDSE